MTEEERLAHNAYAREWYHNNGGSAKYRGEHRKEWEVTRRKRNADFVLEYKAEHPCACGEMRPWCLQFHHRDPSNKHFNISSSSLYALDKIIAEIAKCDILCANCHFDLHHLERAGEI